MDSKIVIFFVLVASANCLISDDIYNISRNKQCIQFKPVLDSLGIESCRTAGDRGAEDLICNGIKSIIEDICNGSSSITIQQVNNLSTFNDSLKNFCENVQSLSEFDKLPINVSDSLNYMKNTSCAPLCTLVDGKLKPMCPFLISYVKLKTPVVAPKKPEVPNANAVKNPEPVGQNTIDRTKSEEKPSASDKKPLVAQVQTNKDEPRDSVKGKPFEPLKQEILASVPANKPSSQDNDLLLDSNLKPENSDTFPEAEGNLPPSQDDQIDIAGGGNPAKQVEQGSNDDVKPNVDQGSEPSGSPNKAVEQQDTVNISSAEREPFDEAESSNFFVYFVFISAFCIFFYVAMYNKKKILALLIEGRRSNVKRRPNSAAYSKLDCTLEEAMASSGPSTSTSNTLLY